jgi:hypothetical protein
MPMGHLPRRQPMGMDPNYQGGQYRGQRFEEQNGGAAYGRYRAQHGWELSEHGGPRGDRTGMGQLRRPPPSRPSGPIGGPRPRNPGGEQGYNGRSPQGSRVWGAENRPYDRSFRNDVVRQARGNVGRRGVEMSSGRPPMPQQGRPRGPNQGGYRMADSSRGLRYDGNFGRYGGFRSGGFSEGFLGSAF